MNLDTLKSELKKLSDEMHISPIIESFKERPVSTTIKAVIVIWLLKKLYAFLAQ